MHLEPFSMSEKIRTSEISPMFNKQAIALAFISKFVYGKEFFDIPLTKINRLRLSRNRWY